MSQSEVLACTCILRECFNERIETVGKYLAENGPSQLRTMANKTGLRINETQTALRFLIKHNMVEFTFDSVKNTVLYSVNLRNIRAVVRSDRYTDAIRSLYGHDAEAIVRDILLNGQMSLPEIVTSVLESCADRSNGEKRIYEKFVQLVQTHFVRRCPALANTMSEEDRIPDLIINESQLYDVPSFSNVAEEMQAKMQQLESSKRPNDKSKIDTVYWCVNIDRFNEFLRDQTLIHAISKRVHPQAAEIVRTLLRRSEVKSPEGVPKTVPISFYELLEELPKDLSITNNLLEKWLKVLTEAAAEFIQQEGDGGGGQYSVYFQRGFAELCKAHIESIVQERYGSDSKRVIRILMMKNQVEMSQIEILTKIDPKEATGIVYRLLGDNFISVVEVAKSTELVPKHTFYYFSVDVDRVAKMLLDRSFKTLANLILRRMHESKENKRLIDKEQRMLAILAQIDSLEEKEEFQRQMTPAERTQLEKYNHAMFMLMKAEQEVDETIFILETYLSYSK